MYLSTPSSFADEVMGSDSSLSLELTQWLSSKS
jgi:hypothetical protein